MDPFLQRIQSELSRIVPRDDLNRTPTYLLAVSGGMDSMAMLHAFLKLGIDFSVAHFNFKLRGEESDNDQALIEKFCNEHSIRAFIGTENTKTYARQRNLSTQVAARELRYQFFDKLILQYHIDYLCTAHHGNDQLETFFINLLRGSGLKGLTGIPQKRGKIIRPMLWIPHQEIDAYVRQHQIPFHDDHTNQSDEYLRNRIRHQIIEPLTKNNPEFLEKSLHSINLLKEYQGYVEIELDHFRQDHVQNVTDVIQRIRLDKNDINSPSNLFLLKLFLLERGLYPDSVENFLNPSNPRITGNRYLGNGVDMWYDRHQLWLITDKYYQGWDKKDRIKIPLNTNIVLPGGDRLEVSPNPALNDQDNYWSVSFDIRKIKFPLYVRHRQPGDVIMWGSPPYFRKSLKKLLIEKSIPAPFKDRYYVMLDSNHHIIALPGIVTSPKYALPPTPDSESYRLIYHSFLLDINKD